MYHLFEPINSKIKFYSRTKLFIIILITALVFHFPSKFDEDGSNFRDQKTKSENLLSNAFKSRNPGSHAAKLESRILVPFFIKTFNLNKSALILFALLTNVIFLYCFYFYFNSLTSRENAFWITMAVTLTYLGSMGFTETRFIFDTLSLSLVFIGFLLLVIPDIKFLRLFSILAFTSALLNDERSVFTISGFVILSLLYQRNQIVILISALVSVLFYLTYRIVLNKYFNVVTPTEGVSLSLFIDQINNVRIGYLMFGEGFFILIYYWFKQILRFNSFVNCLFVFYFISSLLSFTVVDIGRSLVYWFPMFLIGFESLLKEKAILIEKRIHTILLVCLFVPTYYVTGKKSVWTNYSVIEQGIRFLIGKYE